jgi:uncharacterized protein (TIGR03083 family)
VLADVEAERREFCEWLEPLEPSDWEAPSLCVGWSVRDVVAHLTLSTRTSASDFVKGMLRYRGNFERMEAERARARATKFSPDELIEQLRAHAASAAHTVGSSPLDALTDIIVHGQDIARPLRRTRHTTPDRVARALNHVLASRWYGAKKRLRHVTLRATDTDYISGTSVTEIHGPAIDLLLVATGRRAGLDTLAGVGVDQLRQRLNRATR